MALKRIHKVRAEPARPRTAPLPPARSPYITRPGPAPGLQWGGRAGRAGPGRARPGSPPRGSGRAAALGPLPGAVGRFVRGGPGRACPWGCTAAGPLRSNVAPGPGPRGGAGGGAGPGRRWRRPRQLLRLRGARPGPAGGRRPEERSVARAGSSGVARLGAPWPRAPLAPPAATRIAVSGS